MRYPTHPAARLPSLMADDPLKPKFTWYEWLLLIGLIFVWLVISVLVLSVIALFVVACWWVILFLASHT